MELSVSSLFFQLQLFFEESSNTSIENWKKNYHFKTYITVSTRLYMECLYLIRNQFPSLFRGNITSTINLYNNGFTRKKKRVMKHFSLNGFRFRITYRLILREKELHFHIGVYNPSKDLTFSFNLLLHTYLKVPDVRRCQITGLHGCTFIDKVGFIWNCFLYSLLIGWRNKKKTFKLYFFPFTPIDKGWSNLPRRQRRCYYKWMDRQNLPAHITRAHNYQCRFG